MIASQLVRLVIARTHSYKFYLLENVNLRVYLILLGWWTSTFRNIARLFHVHVEIIFCSISFLQLSVTQVKIEGSSKKMLLQEVIKKIKVQKKTFIIFSTKIDNSSSSDIDIFMLSYLCRILWQNFIFKCYSICVGFYAGFFRISILERVKINFKKLNKVKVEKQISIDFVII